MDLQRAQLAYDASLRALDEQRRELGDIRSRTGILLGTSSLTASVLGARALDDGLAPLGLLALDLAFWLHDTWVENDRVMGSLDRRFRLAVTSLVMQLVFSSVAVTGTLGGG